MSRGPRLGIAVALAALVCALWFALGGSEGQNRAELSTPAGTEERGSAPLDGGPAVRRAEPSPVPAARSTEANAAPRDLVVRVVDARGEPVDDLSVQLTTELAKPDERGEWQLHHHTCPLRPELPRHGRLVSVEQLGAAFQKAREAREAGLEARVFLRASSEVPACSSCELDERALPAQDLVLQLEPTGFLRLEAMRPDGSVYDDWLSGVVSILERPSAITARSGSRLAQQQLRFRPEQPRVRVPVGVRLRVSVHWDFKGFLGHREEIAGPAIEGEEVLLRLTLRLAATIAGRLISEEGEPVRNGNFYACHELPPGMHGASSGRTDGEGRFRVVLQSDPLPQRIDRLRIFPLPQSLRRISTDELENEPHAVREQFEMPASGECDLGDVQIQPSGKNVFAEGLVVDSLGAPIEDVRVYAPAHQESEASSDAHGRFRIYSSKSPLALRLIAQKEGWFQVESVQATARQTDVRIVMSRGGTIEGLVLLPEHFPARALQLHRVQGGRTLATLAPRADGRFRFEGCAPGEHALAFQVPPWKPVLELPGFVVYDGLSCTDTRLREIDLRRVVTALRIRALDARGEPLVASPLQLSTDGSAALSTSLYTDQDGRVTAVLPFEVPAVVVSRPGGAPVVVRVTPGETEVRFAEPIELGVVLDPSPNLPDGIVLKAMLELEHPSGKRVPIGGGLWWTNAVDDKLTFRAPIAGRYRLSWRIDDAAAARGAALDDALSPAIDVAAEPSKQSFRVAPPPDLSAALKRIGR